MLENKENIFHTHNGITHCHPIINDNCSSAIFQYLNKKENIADSDDVILAKQEIIKFGKNEETLMKLYKALCLQLRYQEAITCCKEMLNINPTSYKIKRLLAIRYLTTFQNDKAYDLFLKLENETNDYLDIYYRLGLCLFYMQKYDECIKYFIKGLEYSKDNQEMYVACLYWYLFALIELKQDITVVLNLFTNLTITHHKGYQYAIELFLNKDIKQLDKKAKSDDLTRIMYLLGKYYYFIWKNESIKANEMLKEAITIKKYWASFSGLGFWNIYLKKYNEKKKLI